MLPILIPHNSLNYIGAFLTFDCNLNCSYCINDPEQRGDRKKVFEIKDVRKTELTPMEWSQALGRLPLRSDLPVTFQGGEPTLYWKGSGFGLILENTTIYADLLTNFALPTEIFAERLRNQTAKLRRNSPYPKIRVSFHIKEMDKLWGEGFKTLVSRCESLKDYGFRVDPDPAKSDVGIYVVDHPENVVTEEMQAYCKDRLPFFLKDFLGVADGELHGQYGYPYSTDLISSGLSEKTLDCECRTTELLIDPLGFVWRCHYYLYKAWETKTPVRYYDALAKNNFDFASLPEDLFDLKPVGHMLDPAFSLSDLEVFRPCDLYGRCIGCDTKLKRDRFGTENIYRSSVVIKNIQWPAELKRKISNDYTRKS